MEFVFRYIWTPISVFVLGYLLIRFMGKKAVAEMTGFELLAILVLGTAITEPIVTKRLGIASYYSVAIVILYMIFSRLSLVNGLQKLLKPSPRVLIRGGDIDQKALKKERVTVHELLALLRINGYTKAADIEMATIEETGRISFIPKSHVRPVQPKDLGLVPSPTFIPIPVIIEGEIIYHNIKYLGKDMDWLIRQLQAAGVERDAIKNITIAILNQEDTLEVDIVNKHNHDSGSYNYKPGRLN
ncbi:DUF421 domain-containing protein [Camelliibacillus cellulosilyticus]|uniref:DUF421 domain-containing protein n=1 Tax=Camelliibacillus cellulosilyticus TaxID=2174486 RepID=A0ABV9GLG7_9BACL